MKDLTTLGNGELIDFVYTDIAGKHIRDSVKDWTQPDHLTIAVNQLQGPTKTTYLIGILNQQVLNGGFIQYYDNRHGRFAYETLTALKEIKATKAHDLLRESLELINPKGKTNADFRELIINRDYETSKIIEDRLDELDTIYYSLADIEDLEQLLGDYLKLRIEELK
jgi:hypothetical protein